MVRRFRLRQVDVFTDRPLAGNPLAVFPEAAGLSEAEMQALAAEMNLSETAFVLPPTPGGRAAEAAYRVRIFMPRRELPFAGHPVVGTAWVLADEGHLDLTGPLTEVRNELGVGVLPLTVARDPDGRPGLVTMTQGQPRLGARLGEPEQRELAAALGVGLEDFGWIGPGGLPLTAAEAPPRLISTGLPYLVVPFRDRRVLAGVATERAAAAAPIAGRYDSDSVALVGPGTSGTIPDADVHVRVLCDPVSGVLEDPATGSAAGPIAVYLGMLAGTQEAGRRLIIEQGIEIGRPSRLDVSVAFDAAGAPAGVRLSGRVVPILAGTVSLP
ncbi:MAG: PhzF family phenazine biosynthesis protein [Chloroflexota bacterium]|nr:MAG: PhzF family phenazine biosynthesis protein [Chloroflexota bacterium]